MPLWPRILSLWRNVSRGEQVDRDLDEELRAHLDLLIEEKVSSGMSQAEARREALIEFGGVEQTREEVRASRTGFLLETLWQDLRYGVRMLARSPGFTATAVTSLALGIGATTAVFSILEAAFMRPLPYPDPDRLVIIAERRLDNPDPDAWQPVSTPTFEDWKKQSQSLEEIAEATWGGGVFSGSERAEEIWIQHVSEEFFQLMGAQACQRRLLIPDDYVPGQATRAVLSYPAWQRLTGANPLIVGSTVRVNGNLLQVIGVMSPEYRSLLGGKIELWVCNFATKRDARMYIAIGRLKQGIGIKKAQAEMDVIEARLAQQYAEQRGYRAHVQPLHTFLYGQGKTKLLIIFGAVVLVLLIACLNVANLLLARGTAREKEMAVRSSLGGSRSRLVRQMLTESLLLSCLGTGLGLLLAYASVYFAVYLSPENPLIGADEISINVRILGFTLLIAVLTAFMFGLLPALWVSKPHLTESLKAGGYRPVARTGRHGTQNMLVIGQIALSLPLLVGAGLMIHNVWRLLHKSVGFNTDHVAQISIRLPSSECTESTGDGSLSRTKPKRVLTIKGIEERLRALPGVSAVGLSGAGVLYGCDNRPMGTEGPPRRDYAQAPCYEPVSPGYFGMLEIPVLKGRVFTDWDSGSSLPVAVISQSAAQRFFASQDPIGKMINIGDGYSSDFERRQVVGVVADVHWTLTYPFYAGVYYPYSQVPPQYCESDRTMTFLVRSVASPAALVPLMVRVVPEVNRDVVISAAETVDNARRSTTERTRFFTWTLAAFAGTALAVAAVGVFGVMSYSVARRTHEIGVRMAIGAQPGDVLRLVLRTGIHLTSIGLAIGLTGALILVRLLGSQLPDFEVYEVKPLDPASLAAVCLLLALVALLACYIPARRAARMNPLTSLRYE